MAGSGETESASQDDPSSDRHEADGDESSSADWEMPEVGELDYIWGAVKRALLIASVVLAISVFAPQLIDRLLEVLSQAERLQTIRPGWFVLMVLAEILSFASLWWLMKILLPKLSWFVAATSQLTSNSVSRVFPGGGGAAAGGATMFRMLAVSGTSPSQAGGALAATSILSTAALAAIPAIGITIAFFGAPIPEGLSPIAIASGVMCVLLLGVGGHVAKYRTVDLRFSSIGPNSACCWTRASQRLEGRSRQDRQRTRPARWALGLSMGSSHRRQRVELDL